MMSPTKYCEHTQRCLFSLTLIPVLSTPSGWNLSCWIMPPPRCRGDSNRIHVKFNHVICDIIFGSTSS
jgi:hypothetical protein